MLNAKPRQQLPVQQQQANAGEPSLADLKLRLGELTDRAQAIQAKADTEKRDLTQEESGEIDRIFGEFEKTEIDIKRRETIAAQAARASEGTGRRTEADQPRNNPAPVEEQQQQQRDPPRNEPARVRRPDGLQHTRLQSTEKKGRWGFAYPGEFYAAVRDATVKNRVDRRLEIKGSATTWGNEGVGEDGGFAVPPDWRSDIVSLLETEDSLIGLCDQQRTSSNQLVVPVDENEPWYSSGVRAYWLDEASTKTQTKPVLQPLTTRANKLAALVYLTDELIEDAPAMGAFVQRKAPAAIQWKINDALINGNGAGMPLGILNSPALVTVAIEASQPNATLKSENITKMYARMHANWRRNAVWLYNQDIEPQLFGLVTKVTNVAGTENVGGGFPLYMPPGGLSASPYGTLMGRPMIATEACSTIGTVGDIILANMQMYLALIKTGGIRFDMSIHVEFERDMTAFRFVMRIGGQPWLSKPVTRRSGNNTLSPFVTLAGRP